MTENLAQRMQRIEDDSRAERKEIRHMVLDVQQNIKLLQQQVEGLQHRSEPMISLFNGMAVVKNIVVGLAAVIIAIGAIGAGVIWLINAAVNK